MHRGHWRAVVSLAAIVVLMVATHSAVTWAGTHRVVSGDTLSKLAQQYSVSVDQLAQQNGISNPHQLQVGTILNVGTGQVHTIRRGDTFFDVARLHGVTTSALMAANTQYSPTNLPVGARLSIPGSSSVSAAATHTVRTGDTLSHIAQRYGTTVNALRSTNNLSSDRIYPGMTLRLPSQTASRAQSSAQAIPWSTVDRLFPRQTTARVTDVWTGLSFMTYRRGGWAHADVEPLTRQDTETLRRIYGGSWSWSRRPVIVEVGGYRIAASMNGMPHGGGSLNNNFPGHHCIHFLNSTTHGTRRVCSLHQQAVRQATGR